MFGIEVLPLIATVLAIFLGAAAWAFWAHVKGAGRRDARDGQDSIPSISGGLPFVGHGLSYFAAPSAFLASGREKHGDLFCMKCFGAQWFVLFRKEDVAAVLTAPEKELSLLKAYQDLGGRMLPQDDGRSYPSAELRDKFLPGKVSGTPVIAHSVRPAKIRAWTPAVRELMRRKIDSLPESSGTVDLFAWCKDIIVGVTVRVILGEIAAKDEEILVQWVNLFLEADPEKGFESPTKSFRTAVEVALRGEREVYRRVRALSFPLIDAEIDAVIQGEKQDDSSSVLSSMVRSWFDRLGRDPEALRLARLRIANDLFNFTFASFSNSYANAAWCMWHILNDTNGVGERIRTEMSLLEKVTEGSGKGEGEILSAVDYPELERCILEVGRLYTPGSLPRKVMKPFAVPSTGHTIPPGATLIVSSYHAMRDSGSFAKPLDFDPSRYDGKDRDERPGAGALFHPFGTGAHPCVGRHFANLEIAVFVLESLRGMEWSLVDDSVIVDEFTKRSINVPNHPPLISSQAAFIFRAAKPVLVRYERRN